MARQTAIQNFARATKPGVRAQAQGKTALLPISPSKKRKLNELGSCEDCVSPKTLKFSVSATPEESTKTIVPESSSPSPSPSPLLSPLLKEKTYPPSLLDLQNLHAAFLKALTIHFAQRGRSAPVDLADLLGSVTRIWRKRKVVVKDVQRLVWVWSQDETASERCLGYRIANYGLGKICLERVLHKESTAKDWFDEDTLQERFEEISDSIWRRRRREQETDCSDDISSTLGLAPVHESLTPLTSFRKGQQRLQDLKGGIIRAKTEQLRAQADQPVGPKPLDTTTDRRQSLMSRIKSKELLQSKLPAPPSKDALLCRAAAQRVEEVVAVLALLRPTPLPGSSVVQRKPFQLEMVVQHAQDSLRNPISRDEVEKCVEILARLDVAGHWVALVTVRHVKSVVLKSCSDVSPRDIGAKVAQMKIGYEAV
ncbi:hypothetical protein ASPZODRAFT_127506 [Penicilliopsis zonata CBS 506.65]|uniref:DNA replication factor Cdt1 C-terminal domain-containing protein n=1 Tax=Penicilliopsis zonata CBS 506.65 TaxID=1073090 RepID=A0A1L9SW54_9EURO|nr:hypothetical protein ASPZODRAFT_127506 [Penicilliopsis zonata CBS 506.65]OJJ51432.1 hypothetical protein ASPZODRAFT_127506 [Penicilliopsis zonata CBS 506.65]